MKTESGRIAPTHAAEAPLPGEMEALDEAFAELNAGKTHRLDDLLNAAES